MSSRTRSTRGGPRSRHARRGNQEDEVPEVYREMLAEAEAREAREGATSENERPSKRFKPASSRAAAARAQSTHQDHEMQYSVESGGTPSRKPQIVYNSPSESSEESDMEWEEVDIQQPPSYSVQTGPVSASDDAPMQITLGQHEGQRQKVIRRKPVTASERKLRLDVHKTHLLCLMSHVQRRNLWCNDDEVQGFLKKMLPKSIISLLNPSENKPQYARSTTFVDGLNQAGDIFTRRFRVTKPGMKRTHWSYDSASLKKKTEAIMSDAEVILSREDFRRQAKTMQGSRDFGAQLFCALLRSIAVDARLVCSLQPLPFSGTTRDMTPPKPEPQAIVISSDDREILINDKTNTGASPQSSRVRRLGQPSFKPARFQTGSSVRPKPAIRESAYPIFWVEAFNEAMQKWIVIDPMVTKSLAKPHKLEPPAADVCNCMSYVVAFEEDASARDVTRRYAKAFNAKTRKLRVESTRNGQAWWNRVLQFFEKPFLEDRDELEIGELTAKTASEPMPRNVQDFKDHPIYALERHLRRNEAIFPKRVIGHVSLGKSGSKNQTSEPIYRRSDVHTLRSANKWYRLGRDIKMGEQGLKRIPANKHKVSAASEDEEDVKVSMDTPLYAFSQTELYKPPPVVNGKIPKNLYGNLDVYVPSMVPPGGTHITHPDAAQAARILSIDYADAVTGFNFKGRHGTAIFQGVIVATEYREALEEVLRCLDENKLQDELEQKSAEILRLWKHFLLKLRIAERVKSYAVEGEEADDEASTGVEKSDYDVEETGGGFLPESDQEVASPRVRPPGLASESGLLAAEYIKHDHPTMEEEPLGGGFIRDTESEISSVKTKEIHGSGSKYSLVVVSGNRSKEVISVDSDRDIARTSMAGDDPKPDEVKATEGSSGAPIMVESSTNADSTPASLELLSRAPSQTQSGAQSPEVLSQGSESNDNEGSLLSQDPEDEDAVPEWLMFD